MEYKNLLKDSKAYYGDNDYYEIFSKAEDGENKVRDYLKELSENKIVVDAGCGTGKFLSTLEISSKKYIGIDLSDKQLEVAKNKSHKTTSVFINTNLNNIPIEDDSVDLIISTWVLGTITDLQEREQCLNELKRILKKDGVLILVENNTNCEFEILRGHDKDTKTQDYNNWIINHDFIENKKINTYFNFENTQTAKKCFEVIYGKEISNKINKNQIEHKIIIFKYKK